MCYQTENRLCSSCNRGINEGGKYIKYKLENPSEELAFVYYILFICSHAYAMRRRTVLWMRNCFKYGTIGELWKQIQ